MAEQPPYFNFGIPNGDLSWLKNLGGSGAGSSSTGAAVSPVPTPGGQLVLQQGYMPDYASLISNSPILQMANAQSEADLKQAAANRTELLRQLAIRYGGLPSGFGGDKYHDINDETLQLASQNEQSDIARINRQYDDNIAAARHALAARGALDSGELQYSLDRSNMAKESSVYDAGNAFADAARSAINSYLGAEQSVAQAKMQAMIAAAQSIYANPAYAPVPQRSAQLVPNWQIYGQPIYSDGNGNYYTSSGAPFDMRPYLYTASGGTPTYTYEQLMNFGGF